MTLSEFLLARIAEDEAAALDVLDINQRAGLINGTPPRRWKVDGSRIYDDYDGPPVVRVGHVWVREADHIVRWDPARVLAECEVKRRIVEMHWVNGTDDAGQHDCPGMWVNGCDDRGEPCPTLRLLALPYSTHPDYLPEWSA